MSKNHRARLYAFGGRNGFVMKRMQLTVSRDVNLGLQAAILYGIHFFTVKSLKMRLKQAFSYEKMQFLRKRCSEPLQTSYAIQQLQIKNFPIDFSPTFDGQKNQSWSTRGKEEIQYSVRRK